MDSLSSSTTASTTSSSRQYTGFSLGCHNPVFVMIRLRDGTMLVGGSFIERWGLQEGPSYHSPILLNRFVAHTNAVTSLVELNSDGDDRGGYHHGGDHFFLSGSWDKTIRKWSIRTGECLVVFESATSINAIVLLRVRLPGVCVVASDSKRVMLWNMKRGDTECYQSLYGHTAFVTHLLELKKSGLVASGSWDHTIRLWDVVNLCCIRTLSGHRDSIQGMVELPNGRLLASCGLDGLIKWWSTDNGSCRETFTVPNKSFQAMISLESDPGLLVTGYSNGRIDGWKDFSRTKVMSYDTGVVVWSLLELPKHGLVVSGHNNGRVMMWKLFKTRWAL